MSQTLTITEVDFHQAQLEQREAGRVSVCHCLVAAALFRELNVPVQFISYVAAVLQDGREVRWYNQAHVSDLIRLYDYHCYSSVLARLPCKFEIAI